MASVNLVILMGNLGQDPDLKFTQQGLAICKFSLATTAPVGRNDDGSTKFATEWHNIMITGKDAENAKKYLKQGDGAHITGKKQTSEWTDKDGHKHSKCEILSRDVIYLPKDRKASTAVEHESGNYALY